MSRNAEPRQKKQQQQQQRPAKPETGPETERDKAAFTSYYLQRATREFAEDLDAVRAADDFSSSSGGGGGGGGAALRTLVGSLTQGVEMFSPAERRRVVAAATAAAEGSGGE